MRRFALPYPIALAALAGLALHGCGGDAETTPGDAAGDTTTGPSPDGNTPPDTGPTPDLTTDPGLIDSDGDGVPDDLDCAPLDATIYPGAPELCDDILQDCDGSDPAPAGIASFFPTAGPGVDITAALKGSMTWIAPSGGRVVLCGGSWTGPMRVPAGAEIAVEARDGLDRPQWDAFFHVLGDLTVTGLDVTGYVYADMGPAAGPEPEVTLKDVRLLVPSAATQGFNGTLKVNLEGSDVEVATSLLGVISALSATDTTIRAARFEQGLTPFLPNATMTLRRVEITMEEGAALFGNGTATIEDSHFTTLGAHAALQVNATGLSVKGTRFTSAHDGDGNQPLLDLLASTEVALEDLTFEMKGERGGIRSMRGFSCEGCAFEHPARQPAVEMTFTGQNVTIRDSTFTGLPGEPVHDVQRFITFSGGGRLTLEGSTFTGGYGATSGGAVQVGDGALTVKDSTFTANTSGGTGGAVYTGGNLNGLHFMRFEGSTFSGNAAAVGGAIGGGSIFSVTGCTFTDNTSTAEGAAIRIDSNQNASIGDSTFHRNIAGLHAAIVYLVTPTMTLQITRCDLGAGDYDNSPNDIGNWFPANGGQPGNLTHNAGADATFTCRGNLSCD